MAGKAFTAEEFETWIPARETYRRAQEAYGAQGASTILSRCATGLMHGRAEHIFIGSGSRRKEYGRDSLIPDLVWEELEGERYQNSLTLWNTNAIELEIRPHGAAMHTPDVSWKLFGIRFDPVGVEKMLPAKIAAPAPAPAPAPKPSPTPASPSPPPIQGPPPRAGGRPKKDYWDKVWAHIAARLYVGTLKADKQSDIEKAMLDWASANGEEMSEQTARARARVLMATIRAEDKN